MGESAEGTLLKGTSFFWPLSLFEAAMRNSSHGSRRIGGGRGGGGVREVAATDDFPWGI